MRIKIHRSNSLPSAVQNFEFEHQPWEKLKQPVRKLIRVLELSIELNYDRVQALKWWDHYREN